MQNSCILYILYIVGRYAIVPITVKPLHIAEAFLLELAADNTVEWEQDGDRVPDLDQPLRVRDPDNTVTAVRGVCIIVFWVCRGGGGFW